MPENGTMKLFFYAPQQKSLVLRAFLIKRKEIESKEEISIQHDIFKIDTKTKEIMNKDKTLSQETSAIGFLTIY